MKEIVNYIEGLEKMNFKDFSEERINGFKEACSIIKEYTSTTIEINNSFKKS